MSVTFKDKLMKKNMLNFSKILEEAEKYNVVKFLDDTNKNPKLICLNNENNKNLIVLFISNPN